MTAYSTFKRSPKNISYYARGFIFILILSQAFLSTSTASAAESPSFNDMAELLINKNQELESLRREIHGLSYKAVREGALEPAAGELEYTGGSDIMISVSRMFPYPGKLKLKKGIVNREINVKNLNFEQRKAELLAEMKKLYFKIFTA